MRRVQIADDEVAYVTPEIEAEEWGYEGGRQANIGAREEGAYAQFVARVDERYPGLTDEQLDAMWMERGPAFLAARSFEAGEHLIVPPTHEEDVRRYQEHAGRSMDLPVDPDFPTRTPRTDRDRDQALRQRPSQHDDGVSRERMYLADEFGTGYLVGDEQGLGRNDTGRQKSTVKAVKVLRPDGSSEWDGLGTDTEAIRDQLATQLSRPIADYEPALARGRRTAEVDARRKELAGVAADLVLERRATRRAVAEVLGCTEKAVGTLVRLGAN